MKIKVTYDREDILKLIRRDLVASGLKHDLESATYKGTAVVSIEVEGAIVDELPPSTPPEPPAHVPANLQPVKTAPPPPREASVDETPADEPVPDMGAILAQSRKNANEKRPMYDPENLGGRPLMEGETSEWPGNPEPRNR